MGKGSFQEAAIHEFNMIPLTRDSSCINLTNPILNHTLNHGINHSISVNTNTNVNPAEQGSTNLAAWLVGSNKLEIRPFKLPDLGDNDLKIRVKAVGICGSDVHYLKHMKCADFVVEEPMVLGHECAGIVEEVGGKVQGFSVGDQVALEPGISCGHCQHCREGVYNLCYDLRFFATPPIHGCLANYVIHPAKLCFKLPQGVSLEEGAMCEPLSVGIHACNRAKVGHNTRVLILGAGAIGLMALLSAKAFGCPRVVMVDSNENRLKTAKMLGASATVCVSHSLEDVDKEVELIRVAMDGSIDVTLDCAGFEKTMIVSLKVTKSGGQVCLIGMGHAEMRVPLTAAASREVDVLGVFRYRNTYQLCLDMISNGLIDVKPLITHRFGFSQQEVEDAFMTSAAGGNAIKVMFNL